MAGTLTISTLSDGTNSTSSTNCIQGSAKAWCNFNGASGSVAIRASYNVSSITYLSSGYYQINFTNALTDANYAVSGSGQRNYGSSSPSKDITIFSMPASTSIIQTSSNFKIYTTDQAANANDCLVACISVFR